MAEIPAPEPPSARQQEQSGKADEAHDQAAAPSLVEEGAAAPGDAATTATAAHVAKDGGDAAKNAEPTGPGPEGNLARKEDKEKPPMETAPVTGEAPSAEQPGPVAPSPEEVTKSAGAEGEEGDTDMKAVGSETKESAPALAASGTKTEGEEAKEGQTEADEKGKPVVSKRTAEEAFCKAEDNAGEGEEGKPEEKKVKAHAGKAVSAGKGLQAKGEGERKDEGEQMEVEKTELMHKSSQGEAEATTCKQETVSQEGASRHTNGGSSSSPKKPRRPRKQSHHGQASAAPVGRTARKTRSQGPVEV
mgnify:CR=1 FL=1